MTSNLDDAATPDKWERRRAARRQARREHPATTAETPHSETATRPRCVNRAFTLWLIIGVMLVPAMVSVVTGPATAGVFIVPAAFSMRAGYRAGRIWLAVLTVAVFLTPLWVAGAATTVPGHGWIVVLSLVPAGLVIPATMLMWRREAEEFYRSFRRPSRTDIVRQPRRPIVAVTPSPGRLTVPVRHQMPGRGHRQDRA